MERDAREGAVEAAAHQVGVQVEDGEVEDVVEDVVQDEVGLDGQHLQQRDIIAVSNRRKTTFIIVTVTNRNISCNIFIFSSKNSNSNYNKTEKTQLLQAITFIQTYAPKNTDSFKFFEYLSFEFEFGYFANLLQISRKIM